MMEARMIEVSYEQRDLIIEAREHVYACTRAAKRDGLRYQEVADRLKRTAAPEPKASPKKKR
jgi:hypothetical protein